MVAADVDADDAGREAMSWVMLVFCIDQSWVISSDKDKAIKGRMTA
jgi:hypothetical protein